MRTTIIVFCKDDAEGICSTLDSIRDMDAELIVYDVSNSAGLEEIIQPYGARLKRGTWSGYGHMRYEGAIIASHDWIFMLHSGEVLEDKVKRSIQQLDGSDTRMFYRLFFKDLFLGKWLTYGVRGRHYHVRIGNKANHKLFNGVVNEDIFNNRGLYVKDLDGYIRYRPSGDSSGILSKMEKEAMLAAISSFRAGRKSSWSKTFLSPVMAFINIYIFCGAIFDGRVGFTCARMAASYTYQKYQRLRQLYKKDTMLVPPFAKINS